jgi:DNA (cytosine-5)-methyltransferase 1
MMLDANVVDLFCGIGGLTHGFRREGFRVVAGVDTDPRCKYAYEENNAAKFFQRDVQNLSVRALRRMYPSDAVRILAGCAPCQPFSLYQNGKKEQHRSEKWRMLYEFARLASGLMPEVLTMENVPQIEHRKVFRDFVNILETAGYWVTWYRVKCALYGIPQQRTRLVLFASRLGAIRMLAPTSRLSDIRTVHDAIGHLPSIVAGGCDPKDRLHRSRNLSELNQRRISSTSEGGWWRDWDDSLILRCHKKPNGKSFRTVYGRMSWNRPSPTITTQCIGLGNGQFGHPAQDRAISLREAALLQTFPRTYRFVSPLEQIRMQSLALHIGNAVPVRLGQVVARSIKRHLKSCGAL